MVKNRKLSKAITDCGWFNFTNMLEYKCKWYGKEFVKIDRFFPSSKTCSSCGYKKEDLTLSVRNWTCPECNEKHDRDVNAAKNIYRQGMTITGAETEALTNQFRLTSETAVNETLKKRGKAPKACLLYTSPSPRDQRGSRMPSSA